VLDGQVARQSRQEGARLGFVPEGTGADALQSEPEGLLVQVVHQRGVAGHVRAG
jgi:hypothetical protein